MKSKYQCPHCQYMSLKKWNVERHVKNIHGIKNLPDENNAKMNIDPQNIRQPPYPIHSTQCRSNQEQQQTFSQDQDMKFRNVSTQCQYHHITHDEAKSRDEIMQEKQLEIEFYRNIVETLESKKKYFTELCSLSKSDMQNFMSQCQDNDIQLICEACQRLCLYHDLKRDSLYKFIVALAHKNVKVQYKRYILESVGAELLPLIRSFIIPLLVETIEKDSKILFHKMI